MYVNQTVLTNQDLTFTMPNPQVTSISPPVAPMDTQVQISGTGFGPAQGSSTVLFNNVPASVVIGLTRWLPRQFQAPQPVVLLY